MTSWGFWSLKMRIHLCILVTLTVEQSLCILYTVLFTLLTPFVVFKFLDDLPRIKNLLKTTKDNKEEVPLKKRIAYMVDVCFSVYPRALLMNCIVEKATGSFDDANKLGQGGFGTVYKIQTEVKH